MNHVRFEKYIFIMLLLTNCANGAEKSTAVKPALEESKKNRIPRKLMPGVQSNILSFIHGGITTAQVNALINKLDTNQELTATELNQIESVFASIEPIKAFNTFNKPVVIRDEQGKLTRNESGKLSLASGWYNATKQTASIRKLVDHVTVNLAIAERLLWRACEKGKTNIAKRLAVIMYERRDTQGHIVEQGRFAELVEQDIVGLTPFRLAMKNNHTAVVKALIVAGVNLNIKNRDGSTLLHYAIKNASAEIVQMLLEKGANPNITDKEGRTPLGCAIEENKPEAVKALIDAGVNINNVQDRDEYTPLHLAAEKGYTKMVKILLEHGADIERKTSYPFGRTPLHIAAGHGHANVVEMLIQHGADVDSKDVGDATPLHIAAVSGEKIVVKILITGVRQNTKRSDLV